MRKNTSSIFVKILLFNTVFITAVTFIFQVVFYSVLDKEYIKQYEELNITNTQRIFKSIEENILARISKIPENYFSYIARNQGITYPMTHFLANNPSAIFELKDRLEDIYLNYEFITSFDLYYPVIETAVTNFDNVHYLKNKEEIKKYLPWLSLYKEVQQKNRLLPAHYLNYPQSKKVITYATSVFLQGKKRAIIGIHIDTKLLDAYVGEQVGHFLMIDRVGNVIYEKGSSDIEDILPIIEGSIKQLKLGNGKINLRADDQNFVLTYQFSDIVDAIYVQINPKNVFYQEYNTFTTIIKMICAIDFIINLLGVFLISKRANRTYGKEAAVIMEDIDEKEITFDLAIKKISNKMYDLNEKVESTKQIVLRNEIRNIIEGNSYIQAEGIIKEKISYPKIYACIIKNNKIEINLNEIEEFINKAEVEFNPILVQIKENEVWLLIAYDEMNYDLTIGWIKEVDKKIYRSSSNLFISNNYDTSGESIIISFKEIQNIRDYYYIYPEKKWLWYKELSKQNTKDTKNHLKIFSQIEGAIKSNNYEEVQLKIEQLIAAFQSGYYSSHYCRVTLRDLVTRINHINESYQINSIETYGYDIRQYFVKIEDINTFKIWILSICQKLIEIIENNKEDIGKELEEKILKIIENNLENDISLEFLADQINMRADTLSKLFKVIMGKNYSEYIKEEKLKYALKLLMTRKHSVKEIADKLGYSSTQYFIKIFKKEFGETPKQYQKKNGG